MTKEDAEPIILDMFYRRSGCKVKVESPREQAAFELWKGECITIDGSEYKVTNKPGVWCYFWPVSHYYNDTEMLLCIGGLSDGEFVRIGLFSDEIVLQQAPAPPALTPLESSQYAELELVSHRYIKVRRGFRFNTATPPHIQKFLMWDGLSEDEAAARYDRYIQEHLNRYPFS
jgi:hypothetical protein